MGNCCESSAPPERIVLGSLERGRKLFDVYVCFNKRDRCVLLLPFLCERYDPVILNSITLERFREFDGTIIMGCCPRLGRLELTCNGDERDTRRVLKMLDRVW